MGAMVEVVGMGRQVGRLIVEVARIGDWRFFR